MTEEIKNKADIFGEEIKGVDLSNKKISHAEFDDCTFISCNFNSTFFQSCTFRECRFEKCDLSLVKLTDTKISDVDFIDSKLIGIDWTMCNWESLISSRELRFQRSVLDGSNFFGLTLDHFIAKECMIKDVDFQNCSLRSADLRGSDFEQSLFNETNLENADFSEAKNISMKISNNHCKDTKFSHFQALELLGFEGIIVQ